MAQSGTYSFRSVNGAIVPSTFAPFPLLGGNMGVGQIVITYAGDHTVHDVSADGVVMPSYISNDSGAISIECQQTSTIDAYLVTLYNYLKTLADTGDRSQWAATTVVLRSAQHAHELNGVSFTKLPDRAYAAQGGKLNWQLMAANVTTL